MYGLVLPGPEITKRNLPVIREIIEQGHELGIHGLDHVYWHDHIKHMGQEQTHAILGKAVEVYRECAGSKPVSFAAPGWMINAHALAFFENNGFPYSSDTLGRTPFLPVMAGRRFTIMQLPSTLPTLDEMVGLEGNDDVSLADYFLGCLNDGLNILSVHTELEGNRRTAFLDLFIRQALDRGHRFLPLIEIARTVKDETDLPSCECVYGSIRGRAGEVTLQSGTCLS
jgi:undecaprenyl phosphate-alpha-L-ara4FN deformylase